MTINLPISTNYQGNCEITHHVTVPVLFSSWFGREPKFQFLFFGGVYLMELLVYFLDQFFKVLKKHHKKYPYPLYEGKEIQSRPWQLWISSKAKTNA
jgi:hypothetical protein